MTDEGRYFGKLQKRFCFEASAVIIFKKKYVLKKIKFSGKQHLLNLIS
ncbi:MAG: hypothetical protein H0U50_02965 [Pyrinomonadaceae bacterium]|nr:hypothetical protein [Pyrinomonadaceae bacterium]